MEEHSTPSPERRCPACGAVMLANARFCGACGTESLPAASDDAPAALTPSAPSAPSAPVVPSAATAETQAPSEAPASPAQAARVDGEGRVCSWCDAVNAPDAVTCVACGAVFPTPAGDEALERAAQARIQSMESELKQRKSGWWPFRSR